MHIILIHKSTLEAIPPVISEILNLLELGHTVTLINTGISDYWREQFKTRGVNIHVIDFIRKGKFGKILDYVKFRKKVYAFLKQENPQESVLWIESASTILCLGKGISRFKYILQLSELHQSYKYQLKAIGKVIHGAEVVFMPEYNRSILYQVWFKLKHRPIILANKPYFLPEKSVLENLKGKYAKYVDIFQKKKIILYQGHIHYMRDLTAFIQAVKGLGGDFQMALMGRDNGMLEYYKKIDPNILHIDFIPAPDYLLLTSLAYIGVLTYGTLTENNIFCAPNKIFEYAAYGLPMIGNDIPGLRYPFTIEHLGEIVDETDPECIQKAILKIDARHNEYHDNAIRFFKATDNVKIINNALKKIKLK